MPQFRKEIIISMNWNDYKAIANDILKQFMKWVEEKKIIIEGANIFQKRDIFLPGELEGRFLALIHKGMGI